MRCDKFISARNVKDGIQLNSHISFRYNLIVSSILLHHILPCHVHAYSKIGKGIKQEQISSQFSNYTRGETTTIGKDP
jgi:hypothetical protein